MSSRRPEKSYADAVASAPKDAPANSDVTPAVPANVIFKLLGFTLAMVAAPIGMYFLTVNSIFSGNSTWAGVTAAVAANVVLFAYIFVAWQEDQGERAAEGKKAQ
ncbi:vacuolar ATPase assembly integral membrane protein vma21 [Aspergillus chevalieri]|uniref:Vacuolar ATPase assembly integral membrane protein vma21 n=1 Tax=Aspergillus chevalieri TaxID=182096 RepID=A0A7R7VV75_ASPCH|nr:vacuolar ATPase assembly integral membrane protein vma21 [Aspergillus chevalieri]BCR91240.1 vacuolar ATPase assembly integral membrane protein vma21 [Aspergillus chevalieri]